VDQSDNSRAATLRNATHEGVADRVDVRDGDMRNMPFAVHARRACHGPASGSGRRCGLPLEESKWGTGNRPLPTPSA